MEAWTLPLMLRPARAGAAIADALTGKGSMARFFVFSMCPYHTPLASLFALAEIAHPVEQDRQKNRAANEDALPECVDAEKA